jgi:hypothetical protein
VASGPCLRAARVLGGSCACPGDRQAVYGSPGRQSGAPSRSRQSARSPRSHLSHIRISTASAAVSLPDVTISQSSWKIICLGARRRPRRTIGSRLLIFSFFYFSCSTQFTTHGRAYNISATKTLAVVVSAVVVSRQIAITSAAETSAAGSPTRGILKDRRVLVSPQPVRWTLPRMVAGDDAHAHVHLVVVETWARVCASRAGVGSAVRWHMCCFQS